VRVPSERDAYCIARRITPLTGGPNGGQSYHSNKGPSVQWGGDASSAKVSTGTQVKAPSRLASNPCSIENQLDNLLLHHLLDASERASVRAVGLLAPRIRVQLSSTVALPHRDHGVRLPRCEWNRNAKWSDLQHRGHSACSAAPSAPKLRDHLQEALWPGSRCATDAVHRAASPFRYPTVRQHREVTFAAVLRLLDFGSDFVPSLRSRARANSKDVIRCAWDPAL
jgi:hypothetical protein